MLSALFAEKPLDGYNFSIHLPGGEVSEENLLLPFSPSQYDPENRYLEIRDLSLDFMERPSEPKPLIRPELDPDTITLPEELILVPGN